MLLLGRRKDEVVMIGDDIEIVVLSTGREVRLGITAPKYVQVHRKEVYDQIQRQKRRKQ